MGAWLDLAIRFWLAKAFLAQAVVSVAMHAPMTTSIGGAMAPAVDRVVASPLGAAIATLCPTLLMIGLCSRVVALPLLFEACALQGAAGPSPLHLYWAVLLGWIIVRGPGAISIDALLSRGLVSTAIPGTAALGRVISATTRVLEPWYRLTLRLWIATAPLAVGATVLGSSGGMLDQVGSWLASSPRSMMAAPLLSLIAAGLLISGLGTRGVAILLMLAVPLAGAAMQLDERLYWALALGILVLRGPGPISLDRLVEEAFRRATRFEAPKDELLPHVVVVGGGFAGLAATRGLAGAACRVTLVDRRNYHLFQPLLYQVATAGLSPADIATPIRSLFRLQRNVRVLLGEVVNVRPTTREVMIGQSSLSYDYLVVATGAQHSYFGNDDWAAYAPGLKTIEDATEIRRRLLTAFERAESAEDPAERAAWMTFVIVGGGPTGVELAGAIAELARHGLSKEFRVIDPAAATVVLVQSAPRLLPTFPPALSLDAARTLEELGVTVRLDAKVEKVDESGVVLAGDALAARTVLWAAGVEASPAAAWLGARPDKAGRIEVGSDLSVNASSTVFAIGDVAASLAWDGKPVPGLAPAAKQSGAYVARVIRRRIEGRPAPKAFRYHHAGSLATIGRQAAVADFHGLQLRGAVAWWLWGGAHILFLIGGRNRLAVLLDWIWAYLTYRRGSRLITNRPTG
jgi:NADH dehydrogenase/putative oxidoreductase